MILHALVQLVSILLASLVFGVFWGPWIALTRSIATLDEASFLTVVNVQNRNLATLMTVLMPITLASIVIAAVLSIGQPAPFVLTVAALGAFVVSTVVTTTTEVPIVKRIITWTLETMPTDWKVQRDRWASFHILRVTSGFVGLALLVTAALTSGASWLT